MRRQSSMACRKGHGQLACAHSVPCGTHENGQLVACIGHLYAHVACEMCVQFAYVASRPSRAIGLALPLVRADRRDCGRVPRASCCRCRRTSNDCDAESAGVRGPWYLVCRPGGSGQARLRLCRGSGPRSGASVDRQRHRRDPRRALWSRSAAPDHSGLAAGGQRAGPRVGTPSPATRRPGGGRRDADPDGGAGAVHVVARCREVRKTSPLDVTTSAMAPVSRALTA